VGELDQFLSYIPKADHLHLHDNHGSRDEHLALGDGEIPWETVGPLVREGYSGVCVIEGRNLVEARQSLEVFRRWF
jgi:sugar phosphate isomerase/epimerase